jgi:hypothetical protein
MPWRSTVPVWGAGADCRVLCLAWGRDRLLPRTGPRPVDRGRWTGERLSAARFNFDLHFGDQVNRHFFLNFAHFQFVAAVRALGRGQGAGL